MLQRVRARLSEIDYFEWLLTLCAFVPYALGWLVGAVVRLTLWTVAAVIAGYHAGKGD